MTPATLDKLSEVLAWPFNILLTGISPEVDWLGRQIDGGDAWLANAWKGALVQVRGDWELHCEFFHLPKWSNAVNMCWLCQASAEGPLRFSACGGRCNMAHHSAKP